MSSRPHGHWWETRCRLCSKITRWVSDSRDHATFYRVVVENYLQPHIAPCEHCESDAVVHDLVAVCPGRESETDG